MTLDEHTAPTAAPPEPAAWLPIAAAGVTVVLWSSAFVAVRFEGKRAGSSLSAADVPLPAGTELSQDPEHVMVAFLGVISEEQLEAELAEAEAELGSGQAGAEAIAEAEAAAAEEAGEDTGSESDKAGEGDEVGETDAPKSETPAE